MGIAKIKLLMVFKEDAVKRLSNNLLLGGQLVVSVSGLGVCVCVSVCMSLCMCICVYVESI